MVFFPQVELFERLNIEACDPASSSSTPWHAVGGGLKVQRLAGEKAVRKCSAQMILRGDHRRMTGVIRTDLWTHRGGAKVFRNVDQWIEIRRRVLTGVGGGQDGTPHGVAWAGLAGEIIQRLRAERATESAGEALNVDLWESPKVLPDTLGTEAP